MNDTRRLIEQVGERAPFPDDAFERMLRRRDRKQRNQRIAAAGVGDRRVRRRDRVRARRKPMEHRRYARSPSPQPHRERSPSGSTSTGYHRSHNLVTVNGVPIEGTMTNGPQHVYRYRWDPVVVVPAGASIVVEETGVARRDHRMDQRRWAARISAPVRARPGRRHSIDAHRTWQLHGGDPCT